MADRYLLESGSPDGYLLEDGSGVYLLDNATLEIVNRANTTVSYVGSGTYSVEKTGGVNGAYDASAVTSTGLTGDFVLRLKHIANGASPNLYFAGVNSDPTTDNDFGSIDFSWARAEAGGTWQIWEGGVQQAAALADATYCWIWRSGTTLGYGRGADLATAQASPDRTTTTSATLYFDSSLYGTGAKLEAYFYVPIAAQALTPDLFTNSQTFHAPTVTATKTLTPNLFTNSQSFFAATVTRGAVDLAPSLFTNAQSFFAPSVAFVLSPSLATNSQTFYGPTVTATRNLTPNLFTNSQTFPAATVSLTLSVGLFSNSQSFFAPTVTPGAADLTPSLFTNAQAFYGPTVELGAVSQTLEPPLLTNASTFYGPTVSPVQAVAPLTLSNLSEFFAATMTIDRAFLRNRRRRRKVSDYGMIRR